MSFFRGFLYCLLGFIIICTWRIYFCASVHITNAHYMSFRHYKYHYVHEAFRRRNQTIHKFPTNDTSFPFTNYVMKQNMIWDHRTVCTNNTFVFLFYLVSQEDYERRQVIRQYVKQNMTVDSLQINYMIVVATDDKVIIKRLEEENALYHDMMVSVHIDNYANVTYTILDSFMWIRDNCYQSPFIARVDGDAWVHFGNLVHYLKRVPSIGFYTGSAIYPLFHHASSYKRVRFIPNDYIERRWLYAVGGAYILSRDLIPYINTGTEYMDVILPVAEDAVIGEIMRMINITLFENSNQYEIYRNYDCLNNGIVPPNSIFVHKLKTIHLLSAVYCNYSSTYLVPYYKD